MNRETETALYLLIGVYLLDRYTRELDNTLRNAPMRVYNWAHDDAGTPRDTRAKRTVREAAPSVQRGGATLHEWLHGAHEMPGKQLTRQAVLAIATHAGFPDPKLASAIAFAESGGVPGAVKRSSKEVSVGLWQINTMVHPYSVADMRDPLKNAAAAIEISKRGTDWSHWTTFSNGKYLDFLTGIFAP